MLVRGKSNRQAVTDEARRRITQKHSEAYGLVKELEGPKEVRKNLSTSSGIVSLDAALGGKLPSGAIEIYGEASVGKTTLLYEIISTAQNNGWVAALCPSEYLDIPYMKVFGMDLNYLTLITGNTGEWVLEVALRFIENHQGYPPCILAIDSATGLRPKDDRPGQWNRMVWSFLDTALSLLGEGSCIVMTNQVRTRRSIQPDKFFVNGEVDSSSRRIVDSFSVRLELSRVDVKDTDYTMMTNIVSSIFSRPSSVIPLPVTKGEGVDTMMDLIRYGLELGVLTKSGAWIWLGEEEPLGQGEANAANRLRATPMWAKRVLDAVMKEA